VTNLLSIGRALALNILKVQLLVMLVVALCWLLSSQVTALSALLGGAISFLGNLFFVFAAFRHGGARKAQSIAVSLFVGELGKLLIVVTGFALVFILTVLPALPLFVGFVATQSVFWFAPLILKKSAQVKHA
jgi:ATP synthase protein I